MTVRTRNIADASITSRALAADVFSTAAHVAANAVDSRSIAALAIGTSEIASATFKTGYIPLDITTVRVLSGGDVVLNTTEAGMPDGNLNDPSLIRINAATDKGLRLLYTTNSVEEIMFAPFALPPDIDSTAVLSIKIRANMAAGGQNTPVLALSYFEGVGDSNAGGNTAALSTTVATVGVDVLATNVGAAGAAVTVGIIPGAHANEALHIYAAWIEYTRIGVGT
jgi:hypothetical protein